MKRLILVVVLCALAGGASAQEKLTLATPIAKSTTEWSIRFFTVEVEAGRIVIGLKDNNGETKRVEYPNATTNAAATVTLITALNTADLSVKSLRRRILERLQADGHLGAGTFSGGN